MNASGNRRRRGAATTAEVVILSIVLLCLLQPRTCRGGDWQVTSVTASSSSSSSESERIPLPLGDINVLVITDDHSWIAGHGAAEPHLNADYGHILSFYQQLYEHCKNNGGQQQQQQQHAGKGDVFLVLNGDWVDGTGLSGATAEDYAEGPSHLVPLLEKMPFDLVNLGRREIVRSSVFEYLTRPAGFLAWLGEGLVTSNVVDRISEQPLGHRYRILRGNNHHTVLAFGFLYDMKDSCPEVSVKEVRQVVREESWFTEALRQEGDDLDAVLVLAHMDVRDELVGVILEQIRIVLGPEMPVQFITGRSRKRDYQQLDDNAASYQGGKYLDTLGFVSFPSKGTTTATAATAAAATAAAAAAGSSSTGSNATGTTYHDNDEQNNLFQYVHLDASVQVLERALPPIIIGSNDGDGSGSSSEVSYPPLGTEDGTDLSAFIAKTRDKLRLDEVVSCLDESYYVNRTLDDSHGLWGLFAQEVVPFHFFNWTCPTGDTSPVVTFFQKHSWQYHLLRGTVRLDDVIGVSPYHLPLVVIPELPPKAILALNTSLNGDGQQNRTEMVTTTSNDDDDWLPMLPDFILTSASTGEEEDLPLLRAGSRYDLITTLDLVDLIQSTLRDVYPQADADAAISLNKTTTTSIWLDYFRAKGMDCDGDDVDSLWKKGTSWGSGRGHRSGQTDPLVFYVLFALVGAVVSIPLAMAACGTSDADSRRNVTFEAVQGEEEEANDADEMMMDEDDHDLL